MMRQTSNIENRYFQHCYLIKTPYGAQRLEDFQPFFPPVWKFFSAKVVMRGAKLLNEKLMDYALLMTCESTARSDRLGDIQHLSTCYISRVWQFSKGCNRGK